MRGLNRANQDDLSTSAGSYENEITYGEYSDNESHNNSRRQFTYVYNYSESVISDNISEKSNISSNTDNTKVALGGTFGQISDYGSDEDDNEIIQHNTYNYSSDDDDSYFNKVLETLNESSLTLLSTPRSTPPVLAISAQTDRESPLEGQTNPLLCSQVLIDQTLLTSPHKVITSPERPSNLHTLSNIITREYLAGICLFTELDLPCKSIGYDEKEIQEFEKEHGCITYSTPNDSDQRYIESDDDTDVSAKTLYSQKSDKETSNDVSAQPLTNQNSDKETSNDGFIKTQVLCPTQESDEHISHRLVDHHQKIIKPLFCAQVAVNDTTAKSAKNHMPFNDSGKTTFEKSESGDSDGLHIENLKKRNRSGIEPSNSYAELAKKTRSGRAY